MSTKPSSETPPAGGPDAETIVAGSEDSQKWFVNHRRTFNYTPRSDRWYEVLLAVGVPYGVFIGIPAVAGLWAAWKILHGGY